MDDVKTCPYHAGVERRMDKADETLIKLCKQFAVTEAETKARDSRLNQMDNMIDMYSKQLADAMLLAAQNAIPIKEHLKLMQDVVEIQRQQAEALTIRRESKEGSHFTWQTAISIIALLVSFMMIAVMFVRR